MAITKPVVYQVDYFGGHPDHPDPKEKTAITADKDGAKVGGLRAMFRVRKKGRAEVETALAQFRQPTGGAVWGEPAES